MKKQSATRPDREARRRRAVKRIAAELERQRQLPNCRLVARILAERHPELAASHSTINGDLHAVGKNWKV